MKRRTVLTAALALPFAARAQEKVRVVASFSILADLVQHVGGDDVTVNSLVGIGQDAHVFSPGPATVAALRGAQLAVVNGLGFEEWWDRLRQASGFRGRVVTVSRGVYARRAGGLRPGHTHQRGAPDPHIWQDPRNVQAMSGLIADALAEMVPARADAFRAAQQAYARRMQELEAELHRLLGDIPRERRRVLTTHDAFGYFADRFGIAFVAAQGVSTSAEPSPQQVANLIRQVRDQRIAALFVETVGAERVLAQIAREANVAIGGRLHSDSLTEPGGEADTVEKMLRHNGTTIARALLPRS